MGTTYCVKRPGECDGECDICPQAPVKQMNDIVNNPAHYTMGGIAVFDLIQSWELDFPTGNVVKYVVRAPYKGNELQDLKKARWYLDQLIKRAEAND